jgi:hypothetical protein
VWYTVFIEIKILQRKVIEMTSKYAEFLNGVINLSKLQKELMNVGFEYLNNNKDNTESHFVLRIERKYVWHIKIYIDKITILSMNKDGSNYSRRDFEYSYYNIDSFNEQLFDAITFINRGDPLYVVLSFNAEI